MPVQHRGCESIQLRLKLVLLPNESAMAISAQATLAFAQGFVTNNIHMGPFSGAVFQSNNANAGDNGVAVSNQGNATAGFAGGALVNHGDATAGEEGLAAVQFRATSTVGDRGFAICIEKGAAISGAEGRSIVGPEGRAKAGDGCRV
jgi:hypothetical protein